MYTIEIISVRVLWQPELKGKCERERDNIFMREWFYCLYATEIKFSAFWMSRSKQNKTKQNRIKWIEQTNNEWIFRGCELLRRVNEMKYIWDWNLWFCSQCFTIFFPVSMNQVPHVHGCCNGDHVCKSQTAKHTVWRECTKFEHFFFVCVCVLAIRERAFHSNHIRNLKWLFRVRIRFIAWLLVKICGGGI